jgi:hypothetical protein
VLACVSAPIPTAEEIVAKSFEVYGGKERFDNAKIIRLSLHLPAGTET